MTISTLDSSKEAIRIYAAPRLYLGNTRLLTGSRMGVWNDSMGVLGMDCLQHYCMQLDFEAGKIRFLNPDQLTTSDLGKAFPLTFSRGGLTSISGSFVGTNGFQSLIDTGYPYDGQVKSGPFRREVHERRASLVRLAEGGVVKGMDPGMAFFSEGALDGETYANLMIGKGMNLIGLKFLARHQVTFNFPKGMMYLKRRAQVGTASGRLRKKVYDFPVEWERRVRLGGKNGAAATG